MSRRRQLLVFCTTVPLVMFGATVGVAAQPDFEFWCDLPKGASYGLCRAGVAVGCTDGSGNAQACANIEAQFLTIAGEKAPWLLCPCNFDLVDTRSPPWGIENEAGSEVYCTPQGDTDVLIEDNQTPDQTLIATGLLGNPSLSCRIESPGFDQVVDLLTDEQNEDCVQKLNAYWDALEPTLRTQGITVLGDLCNN